MMRRIGTLAMLFALSVPWPPGASAQHRSKKVSSKSEVPAIQVSTSRDCIPELPDPPSPLALDTGIIRCVFDPMPVPSVGLDTFLARYGRYPDSLREQGIEGRVLVSFVVQGTDGSLRDVKVLKGVHKDLDSEAVRIVRLMPPWKPARKDGKPIDVYFTMPIIYRLD